MPYFNPQTGRFDINFDLDFDPNQFASELVLGADIDEASKAALASVFAKPEVRGRLKNSMALRSEAQRAMDRARNVATEAETLRDQNFTWAQQHKDTIERWAASQAGHQPGATITAPSGEQFTRAEAVRLMTEMQQKFADTLAAQDESYVGLLADTVELTSDYSRRFGGESLPYADLQKFALEKRMTLRNAYDKFIEPKLETKRKEEMAAAIAAAKEEGRLEALSQREEQSYAGPESTWRGPGTGALNDVLLGRNRIQNTDAAGKQLTGEDAFVAEWNRTRGFTVTDKSH